MLRIRKVLLSLSKGERELIIGVYKLKYPKTKKLQLLECAANHPRSQERALRGMIYPRGTTNSKFSMLKERLYVDLIELVSVLLRQSGRSGSRWNLRSELHSNFDKAHFLIKIGELHAARSILEEIIKRSRSSQFYNYCVSAIELYGEITYDDNEMKSSFSIELKNLHRECTSIQNRLAKARELYFEICESSFHQLDFNPMWEETCTWLEYDYQVEESIDSGYYYLHLNTLDSLFKRQYKKTAFFTSKLDQFIEQNPDYLTPSRLVNSLSLISLGYMKTENFWKGDRIARRLYKEISQFPEYAPVAAEVICRSILKSDPEKALHIANSFGESRWVIDVPSSARISYVGICSAIKCGEHKIALQRIRTFPTGHKTDSILRGWLYLNEAFIHAENRSIDLLENCLEALRKYQNRNLPNTAESRSILVMKNILQEYQKTNFCKKTLCHLIQDWKNFEKPSTAPMLFEYDLAISSELFQ